MHRSGTSLITSWLEASGLVIHNGSFHGPSVGNLKGNFEDKEFVDIHARELRSKYPDSMGWQVFCPDKLTFSSEHRHQLEDLIGERSGKYQLWGWKDPRTVFFLDEWKLFEMNGPVFLLIGGYEYSLDSFFLADPAVAEELFF